MFRGRKQKLREFYGPFGPHNAVGLERVGLDRVGLERGAPFRSSSSDTRAMGRFMDVAWYDLNRTPEKGSGAFLCSWWGKRIKGAKY